MSEIVDSIESLERAVREVERAVKDKWSSAQYLLWGVIGMYLWTVPGQIWHTKWRHALANGIDSSKVIIEDKPHDCAFLAAPLGEKYCHYKRNVATLRWAKSTTGNPIVSYDEGKTWSVFTPDPTVTIPQYSTIEEVYVNWEKKSD
jgi:hypothetical protein